MTPDREAERVAAQLLVAARMSQEAEVDPSEPAAEVAARLAREIAFDSPERERHRATADLLLLWGPTIRERMAMRIFAGALLIHWGAAEAMRRGGAWSWSPGPEETVPQLVELVGAVLALSAAWVAPSVRRRV